MLHAIATERYGAAGAAMARAVESCVHCGFCLPACPTYRVLGQEMDSPRGRIVLMKSVLEETLSWQAAQPHVDRCLGCLACETACPSGVRYRDLISPFRGLARSRTTRPVGERVRRLITTHLLPYPARFRAAAGLSRLAQPLAAFLPEWLQPMLALLPDALPQERTWPHAVPARGTRRARVALLTGCAQQVLDPDITAATLDVLSRSGVEVVIPGDQGCCGGLAWHAGEAESARRLARRALDAFPADVDAIVTTAAGCGSAMHEYDLVLAGTPDQERARAFGRRVMDVTVFLDRIGLTDPAPDRGRRLRVAYHDACHLAHAQGVHREPRRLLTSIPGVELVDLADPQMCCGSAGTYNMDQPDIADTLGAAKARSAMAAGADVLASGNIGCLMQLRTQLARLGSALPVRHTLQVLRDAYTG
jgi:glycolate oxidase iron-sulfur subunit